VAGLPVLDSDGGEGGEEDRLESAASGDAHGAAAENHELLAGGADVGGKQGEEKNEEPDGGGGRGVGQKEADGAGDLEPSGDGDEEAGDRERARDHVDEVGAAAAPVGGGGDHEHEEEGDPQRQVPVIEGGDAEVAGEAKDGQGDDENRCGDHGRVWGGNGVPIVARSEQRGRVSEKAVS
jgi:hypothetical protein